MIDAPPQTDVNVSQARPGPRETIGLYHAIALCVGVVIGAGIFRVPSIVAAASPNGAVFLCAWLAGGLLSIAGALCYAELASAFPSAGGDYSFLRRAYGRPVAFLYGWARLSVIQNGSLAILAYIFGDYLAALWPLGPYGSPLYAGVLIGFLTLLNWRGLRTGAGTQLWLTVLEVAGICAVIVAGFLVAPQAPVPSPGAQTDAVGLVLVFVLLAYGGWSEVVYVSAELRQARRRIAKVLIVSLAIVTLLYLLLNLSLLRAFGLQGIAQSEAVAFALMDRWPAGGAIISLIVAIAAVTSANATAITGARSAYALGGDFPRLGWMGQWNGERGTPANALLLQGVLALIIIGVSAFDRHFFQSAVEYTAPVFWFFLSLVGVALFVLRWREPGTERPFRVPLYPFLPGLFCATSVFLLISSIIYTGPAALVGVSVLLAGAVLLPFLAKGGGA
ncbi:APC family permease [Rhizorhapis sp.]|uniref:APC family permease n=1 Tax=Rhizorhapis sp. TaxID=1968842 RepID=UPI002B4A43D8|nr:amino acid permease [Rhizorhapis sp.]HKR15838.1 amino acid permease [Rhizorhapis sp.]